jgi:RNA polymerase sigma-70 factor, ECF subfamily
MALEDRLTRDSHLEGGHAEDDFVRTLIKNQMRVYAYIVSLVPNRADADEVFQECCVILWSKHNEFVPGTNFLAWACQIALNKIFTLRKTQSRNRLVFDDEFLKAVSDERLAANERLELRSAALGGCLEKLKQRDRELIDGWYRYQGTTKELAEELGRPIDTVYKALKRIRGTLFDCVSRSVRAGETR